ncbi:MAG: hypothetical protein Q8L86_06335 [Vicinamibacterales bacterium]|nr:hypothetical protein [Vicinamibacterales bacterium]
MEVRLFPNPVRPGVGLKPRRESQRPFLPQHARHCPVLEAGSGLGYLVYPALEAHEAFHIEFQGDGRFEFRYFLMGADTKWVPLFALTVTLPVGSVGMIKKEVAFLVANPPISEEGAIKVAQTFIVLEDLGTPPGAVTLRGSTNFRTPPGWDTVYLPVLNMIERPIAPMLVVRVETDWYPQESEFRYVLAPGEGLPGSRTLPIGQVCFVPREEVTLRDCTDAEIEQIKQEKATFMQEKSAAKRTTNYGLEYSPHYSQKSKAKK